MSDENAACPTIGRMMCLPKRITMPVSASTTNDSPIVQCATRSTLEKRSIRRPGERVVGLDRPLGEVEEDEDRERDEQDDAAAERDDPVAHLAPLVARALDEDVGLAAGHRGVLRLGAHVVPGRRLVPVRCRGAPAAGVGAGAACCAAGAGCCAGAAGCCAEAATGSHAASATTSAPIPLAILVVIVVSPVLFLLGHGAPVVVLHVGTRGERLLPLRLVALELVARVGLVVLLARVGLAGLLGDFRASGEDRGRREGGREQR